MIIKFLTALLFLAGVSLTLYGVQQIFPPAAFILLGVGLVLVAIDINSPDKTRRNN